MNGTSTTAIGLVLAGHHPLMLCGLSQVFEKESDCGVLAVCTSAKTALEAVRRHDPEILILDLDLPRNGALTVLRGIQRERHLTRVVVLASAADGNEMVEAARLGARAVILKEMPPETLVTCVRKVHDGEQWLDGQTGVSGLVGRLLSGPSAWRGTRHLTPREAQIARLAIRGVSSSEIAARLGVKQGTVKIHLHSIYDKLKVGGRLGLIFFARRHRLV